MTTKIELIVDDLDDQAGFEAALPGLIEKARKLPALLKLESGKVWPKEDGTPTPKSRTLDLYFAGYDEASAATSSPEGAEFFPAFFGAAHGAVTGLFTDVELDS
ncbi:EthD family reductase [Jatrophihabitans sp. YIM 134969]